MEWEVHKFGGSSLRDSDCFKKNASLFLKMKRDGQNNMAMVLSAVEGVTDELILALQFSKSRDVRSEKILERIKNLHMELVNELLPKGESRDQFNHKFNNQFQDLTDVMRVVWLGKHFSDENFDLVLGFGELWSTLLMKHYLSFLDDNALFLDARDVLVIDYLPTGPNVYWELTKEKLENFLTENARGGESLIITGHIGSTKEGVPTTLKRNGSDYSAAIFAATLKADEIHIWTEEDGVFSADPNNVTNPVVLEKISYLEALELAYFGAGILHPRTMIPAMDCNIPIIIRNTCRPENRGTRIFHTETLGSSSYRNVIKGFATIDSITILNLEGAGMIGVPGISQKMFAALNEEGISVIMISQGSSEYSICAAIRSEDSLNAQKVLLKAFALEIENGHIQAVNQVDNCCILAAVGDNMPGHHGVSAAFFTALSRARINIRMIAQGSSERNISVVLDQRQLTKALQAVHSAFYLSNSTLSIGIVGIGLIGSTLLSQIKMQKEKLKTDFNLDLRIRALSNSKKMLLKENISLENWKDEFDKSGDDLVFSEVLDHLVTDHIPHSVIIDCTADGVVSLKYADWFKKGLHVITPNKKCNSGSIDHYLQVRKTINRASERSPVEQNLYYFYETTVGAGLPVISTLNDLLKTGDTILEIEGIFSGTLSYIFNEMTPDASFSDIVKKAKNNGYTEPDPRDDLSGMDVTRKLVILAREMGLLISVEDIPTESLIPPSIENCESIDEFLERLADFDHEMKDKLVKADQEGKVLRYVGKLDSNGKCEVKLKSYPKSHPFGTLSGSENIISYRTERYQKYPLIIRGPGAGADVTAGGVFSDLLRLGELLGGSV